MFASSKLPLTTGFLAMYRLSQSKNAIAARELRRHLGVCCRSAWRIKHKPMPRQAVIEPVLAFTKAALADWEIRRLAPGAEVYSDGLGAFRAVARNHAQTVIQAPAGKAATLADGARWVNVVLGNRKCFLDGTCHVFCFSQGIGSAPEGRDIRNLAASVAMNPQFCEGNRRFGGAGAIGSMAASTARIRKVFSCSPGLPCPGRLACLGEGRDHKFGP